jgi:hypothetical protein
LRPPQAVLLGAGARPLKIKLLIVTINLFWYPTHPS